MPNQDLLHFRNKLNGLIVVYISLFLFFLYLLGYFFKNFWLAGIQNPTIGFSVNIFGKINLSIVCLIFVFGNTLIITSKELLEDEFVAEMRGKVAFQSFRWLINLVVIMLFMSILSYQGEQLLILNSLLVSMFYVFRFYSSLKFADSNAAPFSILPNWISIALIPITFIAFVLWAISGDLDSFKTYLTIPAFLYLAIITYAYIKLSSYIFQKAA
ncbi:MAG: hypothetical protein ACKVOU_12180 [Cytophagales bacterium]